jgi:hypothetical protein
MQNIWSIVDLLRRNLHWWSPIIFSAYGFNLDSMILYKIMYAVDKSDLPLHLLQSVLSPFLYGGTMIDSFHSSGSPSLFQIELIYLWLSKWIVLYPAVLLGFDQYLVIWFFKFSIAISISQALGSDTSGCAVCISVCLPSLTPCTFNSWEKRFLHPANTLWESVTKSPFSCFTIF